MLAPQAAMSSVRHYVGIIHHIGLELPCGLLSILQFELTGRTPARPPPRVHLDLPMLKTALFVSTLSFPLFAGPVQAQAQAPAPSAPKADAAASVCRLIEATAQQNSLPIDFFTRLIWQESRFHADAIGPVTRNGQRAEGIAQFMPGTAADRKLNEPFSPEEALPKSGEFLAELRAQFGNLGLAAAAYNAGPRRVREFLASSGDLPAETRNYVLAITGHPIEDWVSSAAAASEINIGTQQKDGASPRCPDLLAKLEHESHTVVLGWQLRKVPTWCKGLRHPDVSVCGSIHLAALAIAAPGTTKSTSRSHVHLPRASSR